MMRYDYDSSKLFINGINKATNKYDSNNYDTNKKLTNYKNRYYSRYDVSNYSTGRAIVGLICDFIVNLI